MLDRILLLVTLCIAGLSIHAESSNQALTGTWLSKGQIETRTLTLNDDGKGTFVSDHPQGTCAADLKAVVEGQFAMASGLAPNCQQTATDRIRTKHEISGNTKEGVEDFERL